MSLVIEIPEPDVFKSDIPRVAIPDLPTSKREAIVLSSGDDDDDGAAAGCWPSAVTPRYSNLAATPVPVQELPERLLERAWSLIPRWGQSPGIAIPGLAARNDKSI